MTAPNSSGSTSAVVSPTVAHIPVTLDTKGRVRTSKEQRRVILDEFERSGLSAVRFAERAGLKYSTLAGWVQRYRRTKPLRRGRPVRLLEAVVDSLPGPVTDTPLVLSLPGGGRLELNAAQQVPLAAALLRALEKSC
ncbi:MAG: IS66 family insertion sequence element accessory protein TnpB [Verrucomicrobiota bacterium]|jgi:transposase-like protein